MLIFLLDQSFGGLKSLRGLPQKGGRPFPPPPFVEESHSYKTGRFRRPCKPSVHELDNFADFAVMCFLSDKLAREHT